MAVIITEEDEFAWDVLRAQNPVLCLFSKGEERDMWDAVFPAVVEAMARLKPDVVLDEVIVMGKATPDILARECGGIDLPALRLYHLGREFVTVSFGGSDFHPREAMPITAAFCTALDAPWNKPGVDPQTFRMPG